MVNAVKMIALGAVLILLAPASGAQGAGPCTITGSPNLNFTLMDVNGKAVNLSAYKGKLLLINFWATWCVPCRIEIPALIDLHNRYSRRGLQIVGIAVDEPAAVVEPYAREIEMNYPVLLEGERHDVHEAYGVVGLPTTVIINRDGTTCEQHVGFTTRSILEEAIERLL